MEEYSGKAMTGTEELNPVPGITPPLRTWRLADADAMPAVELAYLRGLNTKTFDLGNGYRQSVVFAHPVHIPDKDTYTEIDNTFIPDASATGTMRSRASALQAACPALSDSRSDPTRVQYYASLLSGEYSLRIGQHGFMTSAPVGMKENGAADAITGVTLSALREKALLRQWGGVEYAHAKAGITLRCILCPQGFKDEWVFEYPGSFPTGGQGFSLAYNAPGLTLKQEADGTSRFTAKDGEVVFSVAPAQLNDAKGEEIPLKQGWSQAGETWELTIIADAERLAAAAWPITLDPVIFTGKTVTGAIADTYVNSDSANTNYVNSTMLRTRNSDGTTGQREKAYLRVDTLPDLKSSDYVVGAYLRLRKGTGSTTTKSAARVRELTAAVNMGTVTFNTTVPASSDNQDHQAIVTTLVDYFFDLTDLVRKWYMNPQTNYGVGLFSDFYIEYYSSNSTLSDAQPYLMVNYLSLAGLEGYLSYDTTGIGRAGDAHVSLYNGNLIFNHQDTASSGGMPNAPVVHYHNSCFATRDHHGLGYGWRCSLNLTLHREVIKDETGADVTYYVLIDGDGTYHHFKPKAGGGYDDLSGLSRTLAINGGDVTITDKGGTQMTFYLPTVTYNDSDDTAVNNYQTALKHVREIKDAREHKITILTVSGSPLKIATVTDGSYPTGRVTTFTYTDGRLSEIRAPGYAAGEGVRFTYDTSGRLSDITHEDGLVSGYIYDATLGLLTEVTDPDERELAIGYVNLSVAGGLPHRVTSTALTGGALTGSSKLYEYGGLTTKVTDNITGTPGKSLVYHFNDMGNLVGVTDELGYSVGAQYTEASPPNHPDTAGRMQRVVVNLLTDGSFELGSTAWSDHNITGTGAFTRTELTCVHGLCSKLITITAGGASYTQQTVTLTKNRAYTLSGYVKTSGSARGILRVAYTPESGQPEVVLSSAPIRYIGEFTRVSVDFFLPSTAVGGVKCQLLCDTAAGSAWFDCIQLEAGETVNRYNLLQNADFRQGTAGPAMLPTYWVKGGGNSDSYFNLDATQTLPPNLTGRALTLYGQFERSIQLIHELRAYGSSGDVYVAGGWAKGYAKKNGVDGDLNVLHCITVQFKNGVNWVNGGRVYFNHEEGSWQMASGPVKAPHDYTDIRFIIDYRDQINYSLFTNLFLYPERYGNTFAYDDKGNLQSAVTLSGTQSGAVYDAWNNLTSYRAPGRSDLEKTTVSYGTTDTMRALRLPRVTTSPLGIMNTLTYNNYLDRPTRSAAHNADSSLLMGSDTEYHPGGNYPSKQIDARGKETAFTYDLNRGTLSGTTAPNGQAVANVHDAAGRVTQVSAEYINDGAQATAKNEYTYTTGKLTQVAHNTTGVGADVQYNFYYDALNRPTDVTVGTQTLSVNTYNGDGTLNRVTYGNDGKVSYTYDAFKRVSGVRYDEETEDRFTYAYDAEGRLGWVKDDALGRVHSNAYDTAGRPVLAQTMAGTAHVYTAEVEYDAFNNVAVFKEQAGSGRTAYRTDATYDAQDRPVALTYGSVDDSITYTYDAIGRVYRRTAKIGGASYVTQYAYAAGDTARYGANATTPLVGSISQTGHVLYYQYDDVGNITRQTYGGKYTYYVYDTLGQLIRVNDPHDPTSDPAGTTWTYHYDQGGNIVSVKRYAHTTGILGPMLEDISYAYGDANWKDKLTAYNGVSITYDEIGNPLTDGTWTYTWQAGRQLASMSKTGATVSFAYNADGLRMRKTVSGVSTTNYFLHGKNIVHMTQGSYGLHFFYDGSGKVSHVSFNGTMYLYVHNLQGDVIAIRDSAGSDVVTYKYDAWGKPLSKGGSLAATLGKLNPFRYRGYVYDEETGLYYLRSRYYNPVWKRFVNADQIRDNLRISSANFYTYCQNSPVGLSDSNGTSILDDIANVFIDIWDGMNRRYQAVRRDPSFYNHVNFWSMGGFIIGEKFVQSPAGRWTVKAIDDTLEFASRHVFSFVFSSGAGIVGAKIMAIATTAFSGPVGWIAGAFVAVPTVFTFGYIGKTLQEDLNYDDELDGYMGQDARYNAFVEGLTNVIGVSKSSWAWQLFTEALKKIPELSHAE